MAVPVQWTNEGDGDAVDAPDDDVAMESPHKNADSQHPQSIDNSVAMTFRGMEEGDKESGIPGNGTLDAATG